ncbi:hypothetical protein [Xanthocytophaga agilis]|uniref:Uncharacterized protein n=1 Tax=Xanthocytophaga agilis TaxID=3048010 RepID=A0AAE3R4G7_9BACT|nr:hypothetical protein [Xanthocytophaga agilis]MDJ1501364.1 hypothetical protein [Xanthocytophaga agilis]
MKTIIGVCGLILLAGWLTAARPGDALSDLGMKMYDVETGVLENVKNESAWYFFSSSAMRKVARQIPESARAEAVKTLGKVVRSYVESPEFKKQYVDWLKNKYPVDPPTAAERELENGASSEATKAAMNEQITTAQQMFAQMPASSLAMALQAQIQQSESEIASLEGEEKTSRTKEVAAQKKMLAISKSNPEEFKKQYVAYMNKYMAGEVNNSLAEDEERMKEARIHMEKRKKQQAVLDAHSDIKPVLRKRLQDFIVLCNSVDFTAKLTSTGYKQEFVNPAYQRKSSEWKMLFRIGKTATLSARDFAQEWLSQLK